MRRRLLGMFVAAAGLLAASAPAAAHHGAATFATGEEVTLKGVVTEWIWANPHCFLKFEVKDAAGAVKQWAVETQNPVAMASRGWSFRSFKAGDIVTVKLEPVKNGSPVGRILSVVLPSGDTLFAVGGPAGSAQ
ncbi:MAG: hypothetical protein HY824_09955 [Acidobacteria bacterium]|nr:hypothetical protein [Acidobacteriota bacterium]